MNNERTRLTDEYLDECMSVLDAVIDICDEVKSSGMSFSSACASRGLDPLRVRAMLLTNVPKLSGMKIPAESVLANIYDGYEKFYHIIFGRKDLELPYDYDMAVGMVLAELKLSNRDEKIVRCYMGLKPYEYPKSFPEVGMEFDISAERVRQICAKTFRRARNKKYQEILVYGPEKYELMKEQAKEQQKAEMAAIKEEYESRAEKFRDSQKNTMMNLRVILENKKVANMKLSTRSHNALRRAGVKDVYTLLMMLDDISEKVRNCGEFTTKEITDVLREWIPENCGGISLETAKKYLLMNSNFADCEEISRKLEEIPITEMDRKPYKTGDLAAKGIWTVADMFRLTDKEIQQLSDDSLWTPAAVHVARSVFAASYGMTEEMMVDIVRTKGESL